MSELFVTKKELKLVNGGYLVKGEKEIPVSHPQFILEQKAAEYIITLAKATKGRDFEGKTAESFEALKAQVSNSLTATKKVTYVELPTEAKRPLTDKLLKEALGWDSFQKDTERVERINDYMQRYNTIGEFEEFGLYFNEEVTKLNNIYTIADIKAAVNVVIDFL